eukprot:TRINITY_DN43857_c0_g1_i1.p1 TRINITY_DN43857_c0_g1~~TRINITY_DN43857_c0_g1_i1.p1  ORF type:complete len:346 (+),score=90.22 TRINITY_DN43857_c0_g1_i1:70-1107(+)
MARAFEELQEENLEQRKELLSLRQDSEKLDIYRQTARAQEKVIEKLERILENSLQEIQKAKAIKLEVESLKTENRKLRERCEVVLKSQRHDGEDVETKDAEASALDDLEAKCLDWEHRCRSAEQQAQLLQKQLIESSQRYGSELSDKSIELNRKDAQHRDELAKKSAELGLKDARIKELEFLLEETGKSGRWTVTLSGGRVVSPDYAKDLQRLLEVERNGLVQINMSNGHCFTLRTIEFVPRKPGEDPVAEFEDEELAMRVIQDVASLWKLFPVPIVVEGHTKDIGDGPEDFWQNLADNRAALCASKLRACGVDRAKLQSVGKPGNQGLNRAALVIHLDILPEVS